MKTTVMILLAAILLVFLLIFAFIPQTKDKPLPENGIPEVQFKEDTIDSTVFGGISPGVKDTDFDNKTRKTCQFGEAQVDNGTSYSDTVCVSL